MDHHYIVTGAASGIGAAVARLLVADGAYVSLVDLNQAALAAMAEELGPKAAYTSADIADEEATATYVRNAIATFGPLSGAFLNAGIGGPVAALADYPVDGFDRVMAVNVRGPFLGLKYIVPHLLERGGAIVLTSSIQGCSATAGLSGYIAAKHAVVGLGKAAAQDYADRNIRVNSVLPGVVDTPMVRALEADTPGSMRSVVPLGRYASPDEIAAAVRFLLSSEASYITGTTIVIDGGATSNWNKAN